MQEMKQWFNKRLESAIKAAEVDMNNSASIPPGKFSVNILKIK